MHILMIDHSCAVATMDLLGLDDLPGDYPGNGDFLSQYDPSAPLVFPGLLPESDLSAGDVDEPRSKLHRTEDGKRKRKETEQRRRANFANRECLACAKPRRINQPSHPLSPLFPLSFSSLSTQSFLSSRGLCTASRRSS